MLWVDYEVSEEKLPKTYFFDILGLFLVTYERLKRPIEYIFGVLSVKGTINDIVI
jgi:hypothetical protein